MGDFLNAAFPWIIMGFVIAIAAANMSQKKKNQDNVK